MAKKTTRIRRTFTPQFKKDAVRLLSKGRSATDVAESLGIARSLLLRWRDQRGESSAEPFTGRGKPSTGAEELRKLKQKLRDVTEERDILKNALLGSTSQRNTLIEAFCGRCKAQSFPRTLVQLQSDPVQLGLGEW
jgi:transposase